VDAALAAVDACSRNCAVYDSSAVQISPDSYQVGFTGYDGAQCPFQQSGNSSYIPNGAIIIAIASCDPGWTFQTGTVPGGPQTSGYCWIKEVITDSTQKPPVKCCFGNPLMPATGDKRQDEVDYRGTGPTPLEYRRVFHSSTNLGTGWRNNWGNSITFYAGPGGPVTATVNRVEGSYTFVRSGSTWVPDADVNYKLTGSTGSFVLTSPDRREIEYYDGYNRLSQINTPVGVPKYTLTYPASGSGPVQQVADAFGHTLSFTYDSHGWLATMTDPRGGLYQYAHDAVGDITSVTYPDGTVRTYVYNEPAYTSGLNQTGVLTGIVDESTNRYANFGYTIGGIALMSEHAGGADHFSVSYATLPLVLVFKLIDVPNQVERIVIIYQQPTGVVVTDAFGTTRSLTFSSLLGSVAVTGSDKPCFGLCTRVRAAQTYDANGNIASTTDFNGNQTVYSYDLTRNLEISRTEASGSARARTITSTWNSTFRLPATITEPNRVTSFTYNGDGNVATKTVTDTTVTPNVTRTWTYVWTGYGQLQSIDGPRTDVSDLTTYTYYSCSTGAQCGQVKTIKNALNQTTTYNTYNAEGRPLTITDPNGVVTTLTYDPRGRLTSQQIGTETTTIAYWPTGLVKQVTLPDGSYLLYTYDAAHRLTQIEDGAGNVIDYTLDAMGNRVAENVYDPSNVLRRTHTRVFNAMNELYQEINAANTANVTTTFGYDSNGNQTSVAAPLARDSTQSYDELNRLSTITDPAAGLTQFAYDGNDNVTQVADPRSLVTSYTYTGFGDTKTVTSPDTGLTTSTYDSGGNLATSTDARSAISTYTYDALNRVKTAAFKIGSTTDQTITYSYDSGTNGIGRLTSASDANHSMSWAYDGLGRVTSKSQTVGSVMETVGYAYTNGNLTSMTTPSGQSVAFGYNTNHQVTSITVNGNTVLSGATYDAFGPVTGWTWGNGSTSSRTFDTDGNVSQVVSAGTRAYGYDDAFRITGITDTANSANSYAYDYDSLDRLTSAVKTGTSRGWTYDATGNRLSETGTSPSTYTVASSSNQLTAITGSLARGYTYDAAGSVLTYGSITATYNNQGRLKTLTNGAVTASYVYNALGERVKQSGGPSGTVHYVYDEAGHLLGEYNSTGALIQETIWLGDTPVATLRPGTPVGVFYVHTDHLNTPRRITQPSDNSLRWTWESDPFGSEAANEDPSSLGAFQYNLRFPGQTYDSQAGLMQNHFRDYDPAIGRYAEGDPIGLVGGLNKYLYAGGNPLSNSDPLGLFLFPGESPVSVVGGTLEQRAAITAAIARIFGTPRGQQMEAQIRGPWYWHGSPKTVHVNCDMKDSGQLGGNELFIDPGWNPNILTALGLRPASLERIIAHELGHTLGANDDGLGKMNNVKLNENPVAIALGQPERLAY
jgi:RHS repeat-associated protein